MKNIYHKLVMIIAGSTQRELATQVRYLKTENQVLRSKLGKRVPLTAREKNRLIKFGSKLGSALNELVTIVHPDTLRRWIRKANGSNEPKLKPKRGRPRTKDEIRELVVKLARENDWGYTRILGELRKLVIQSVSRNTVKNILKEHGLDPGPQRGAGTWDEFSKIHASTLWQCDFFSKKVMTIKGFRDLFVLVFIHIESRRVFISPSCYFPNRTWVNEQAESFLNHANQTGLEAKIVMHDRDSKFTASFDQKFKSQNVKVLKSPFRSPSTVAFVERFIQTLGQDCLDRFIVFGKAHMDYLVTEMVEHYHYERPHQSKENRPLISTKTSDYGDDLPDVIPLDEIKCRERLGGLLKHYSRKAA